MSNELDAEITRLREAIRVKSAELVPLKDRLVAAKRERWPRKCCRCWPSVVNDKGLCGCCDFDHVGGKHLDDTTPECA